MQHNRLIERPALRPVRAAEYPDGRRTLPPRWWLMEFEAGTTLLAREATRRRRSARPLKHDPDIVAQKSARAVALWAFVNEPDLLDHPSLEHH
jgi:hypothetical protein